MVNRPLKDRRPIGPLVDFSSNVPDTDSDDEDTIEDEKIKKSDSVHFESMSDLPESPMLKEYVNREVEYTGLDRETIINSTPVKKYMQRLGVWRQAVDMNK